MEYSLEYGETILLLEPHKNRTYLITLVENGQHHTHQGTVEHSAIAGKQEGEKVTSNKGTTFLIFRPRVTDRMFKVRRQTQIVYPKDAGWFVMALDIFPGARVVEMGIGSGAFTILLSQMVGPQGMVYSFDRREDFLNNALSNISRLGYPERVSADILHAGEPFPVSRVDAVFLDLPNPWVAVPAAHRALAPGRPLALIVPNAEQLKEAVKSLENTGFTSPECTELMERKMLVRQKEGVRPLERMIGFTGYLVSARKLAGNAGDTSEED